MSRFVYANKNCGNGQLCIAALCVLNNNANNLQLKYTGYLEKRMDKSDQLVEKLIIC